MRHAIRSVGTKRTTSDMATVTKKDLIDRIADAEGCKRVLVKKVIQRFLNTIIDELGNGNRLEFRDFGVFEIRHRAKRIAQNPKTLERVPVPAKRTVKFKVGRLMKKALEDGAVTKSETDTGNGAKVLKRKRTPEPAGVR